MARRGKKASGGGLVAAIVTLVFSAALALARVVIQLLLLPFRLVPGGRVADASTKDVSPGPAPEFRDFRHSGDTYEESMANYEKAYEQWKRNGGAGYRSSRSPPHVGRTEAVGA